MGLPHAKYLDVYGDSDWAGDEERTRSSTAVTEIFRGHPLDSASATQLLVALSSAEEDFYACNRGTAGGLQTWHFLTEAVYVGAYRSRISVDQDLSVIVAKINNDEDVKQWLVVIVFTRA